MHIFLAFKMDYYYYYCNNNTGRNQLLLNCIRNHKQRKKVSEDPLKEWIDFMVCWLYSSDKAVACRKPSWSEALLVTSFRKLFLNKIPIALFRYPGQKLNAGKDVMLPN